MINAYLAVVNAVLLQIAPDKPAHLIIRQLPDEAGAHAQPRRSDYDIGRRAADIFGECHGLFHRSSGFIGIEVNTEPADGD
ncbi:hypothetical protein D3C80_1644330 [compost metagenome]